MIEIKLAEKNIAAGLCGEHGIAFDDHTGVYLMADSGSGESLGLCVFEINGKDGALLLLRVQEEGLLLADGLVRATLSLLLDRGVSHVTAGESLMGEGEQKRTALLLKRLQFEHKEAVFSLALTENFFKGHCG